jgi:DNA excision repair protein ERCC-4
VSFDRFLDAILASNDPSKSIYKDECSPWLMLDAAQVIFKQAKERIFHSSKLILEPQPKWKVFKSIIREIDDERLATKNDRNGNGF